MTVAKQKHTAALMDSEGRVGSSFQDSTIRGALASPHSDALPPVELTCQGSYMREC